MCFEAAALYRAEAKRPDRTIPRARYGESRAAAVAGADPTAMLTSLTSIFASQVAFRNAINRYARALSSSSPEIPAATTVRWVDQLLVRVGELSTGAGLSTDRGGPAFRV
ncbi:hypothetical protein [Streptomyces endophyticus]|uniref:Uncharacterized protein n=1 Tax=Streptomyces endophyticus TaxID=714166 RepID=A0ABU6F685_9ACTN|nr:hypothetical protein [Streptomyces endophyticus]MEB8339534.1 hypothetical protein [Streptomyces endophyticus]